MTMEKNSNILNTLVIVVQKVPKPKRKNYLYHQNRQKKF